MPSARSSCAPRRSEASVSQGVARRAAAGALLAAVASLATGCGLLDSLLGGSGGGQSSTTTGLGKDPVVGDLLGVYRVEAKETLATCGAGALGAPSEWEFEVQLSHDGSAFFWTVGGPIAAGTLSEEGDFQVDDSVTVNMRDESQEWLPACSIRRTDAVAGTLDAEDPPESFTGELSYEFEPTAESDCEDLVSGVEPLFAVLPCKMVYDVVGARKP
jgi:hypothetical protein